LLHVPSPYRCARARSEALVPSHRAPQRCRETLAPVLPTCRMPRAAIRTERRTSRVRLVPEGSAWWSVQGGHTTTQPAHRNVAFGHPPTCGRARGGVPSCHRTRGLHIHVRLPRSDPDVAHIHGVLLVGFQG